MIEISRYILALAVVQTHLVSIGADWTAQIAVFGFYTLSGYLMTRVLNERYGFTWHGTGTFLLNRILRLGPAYYVLITLAATATLFLPLGKYLFLIRFPRSLAEIVTNITVIGQVTFDYAQWIPLAKPLVTSWSLSIELCAYVLLALYFGRSPARLLAFAILGILGMAASTGWCFASADPAQYGPYCFQNRYGVIQAGFVPFACGGLFYFYDKPMAPWIVAHARLMTWGAACAVLSMTLGPVTSATVGPFIGIPLMWMLLSAADLTAAPSSIQDFFGRASYHLFIAHLPIAAVLAVGLHVRSHIILCALTVSSALVLSGALVPMERWINVVRRRVAKAPVGR